MNSAGEQYRCVSAGSRASSRSSSRSTAGCGKDGGRIELLAPGGSMESIRAAVNAGADAVYAGGSMFGARAFAENPETGDLLDAIDYCHLHGAKLYLTVNTLLKENELTRMLPEFLAPIYEHGVDAVLVQDFGVFRFLKEYFPGLPLHASTQMTVTGPDGVLLLAGMGAERVVLSRELSLDEIRVVRQVCGVELETFVHGALCYCYSGKCLMSSLIGGRSGNRGRCAQPCRLPWDLYENPADARTGRSVNRASEQYLLSPKDICTLRLIPDLVDLGVASLKIEGRMKSPEYAAGVTAMYRRYIDMYYSCGRDGFHVKDSDERMLLELFSRGGFSEGYYNTRNGRGMLNLAEKKAQKGDSLRRSQERVARVREEYVDGERKIPLDAKVSVRSGRNACVSVSDRRGHSFSAEGAVPSHAQNRPADKDTVRKQMDKTGNTAFSFESIDIDLDDGLFVQVRDLNELRRNALDGIRGKILESYRRPSAQRSVTYAPDRPSARQSLTYVPDRPGRQSVSNSDELRASHPSVTASVYTRDQLEAVLKSEMVGGVYLDYQLCTMSNARMVRDSGRCVYLMLPEIWRLDTALKVKEFIENEFGSFSPKIGTSLNGVLVKCYDQLHALGQAGLVHDDGGFEVIADASLYTWNSFARMQLRELGVTMDTLPYECTARELASRGCEGSECVVYGYQALMTSAQCLVKSTSGCRHEPGIRCLKDRKGILFPVKNDCTICAGTIYNSVPLELVSLGSQVDALNPSSARYAFTIESGRQTADILNGILPEAVTRGHFRKGVE